MNKKIKNNETLKKSKANKKTLPDDLIELNDTTITIDDLYSQLQSLKHEIEIETIQKKLKNYDRFFKRLGDDEAVMMEMLSWYKKNIEKD